MTSCLIGEDDEKLGEKQRPQANTETSTISPQLKYTAKRSTSSKPKLFKSTKRHVRESQLNSGIGIANTRWVCCGNEYTEVLEIHKHVAKEHQDDIERETDVRLNESSCKDDSLEDG